MHTLANLIAQTDCQLKHGSTAIPIEKICFDSRQVVPNTLFIATVGTQTDGHDYIKTAIEKGATAVIVERWLDDLPLTEQVTYLTSSNSAKALGIIAATWYQNPSKHLKVVGVTGTNGKTTVATLLFKLFRKLGYSVGLVSTVRNQINDQTFPTQFTTPDAITLQGLLADMLAQGCTHVFMEVSSHALVQERCAGLAFTGAIFTNITHDHLDFHGTFDNYIKAKKKFFDELPREAFALVNLDDKRGRVMLQNCNALTQKTFALQSLSDFKGKLLENTLQGLLLEINQQEVWFRLIGDFNAYNLMTVYGAALLLGEPEEAILTELSGITGAEGRFEQLRAPSGTTAVVDYAHTPDALKNVLETLEQLAHEGQRIITIIGCGGDRDKAKRPIMARIACEFSHIALFTSDNPRTEPPAQIIHDMWEGLSIIERKKAQCIENRKEAIEYACQIAKPEDIILVAGKGHETYQEIQGVRYPFDDKEMLREFLK